MVGIIPNRALASFKSFSDITKPLSTHLNLSFGYMICFKKDFSYFLALDNANCQSDFVKTVEQDSIWCGKNITSCDDSYTFTLWPDKPMSMAMEVFFRHSIWNGITISKQFDNFIELWWFAPRQGSSVSQDFFLINKHFLMRYIQYFNMHKAQICSLQDLESNELPRFKQGFTCDVPPSIYQSSVEQCLNAIKLQRLEIHTHSGSIRLSIKEVSVLSLLSHGLSAKLIARRVQISPRTVQHHLENIRSKSNLPSREAMINFYYDKIKPLYE